MKKISIIIVTFLLGVLIGGGAVWINSYGIYHNVLDQQKFLEDVLSYSDVEISEDNFSCSGKLTKTVGGVVASILELNKSQVRNSLSYGCYNSGCTISISDCKPWQESECSSRFLKFELDKESKINTSTFTCFDMP